MFRSAWFDFACALFVGTAETGQLQTKQVGNAIVYGASNEGVTAHHQYLIHFAPGTEQSKLDEVCSLPACSCQRKGRAAKGFAFLAVSSDDCEVENIVGSESDVDFVEEDHEVQLEGATSVWGLDRMDQVSGLDGSYGGPSDGGKGVHVYVVDTGIRVTHQDFGGRAVASYDSMRSPDSPDCSTVTVANCAEDDQGHGTHVAGVVAGTTYGAAKGAMVYAVKVMSSSGAGTLLDLIFAIDWILSTGTSPNVISMSLGATGSSPSLTQAVTSAHNAGSVVVVAAGNENQDACGYTPSEIGVAITVAATDQSDARASFSNYGSCVTLFAPGVDILAPYCNSDTEVVMLSGTSCATPYVSGAIALMWEAYPTLSPAQLAVALTTDASKGLVTDAGRRLLGRRLASSNSLLYSAVAAGTPSSAAALATTVTATATSTTTASAANIGLIIGLSVGIPVGVLILCLCCVFLVCFWDDITSSFAWSSDDDSSEETDGLLLVAQPHRVFHRT